MWRRTYLLLVLIRLWFALSPSYIHPDENFQGPEVIAGMSRLRVLCASVDRIFHLLHRLPHTKLLCAAYW